MTHLIFGKRKKRYGCPMHPEQDSDLPGQCPKCGLYRVDAWGGVKNRLWKIARRLGFKSKRFNG